MKIKKDDEVIVISGNYKGTKGKVLKVFPKENKALVEGVNIVKKHLKPTSQKEGGIIEKNMPIHISNIAIFDAKSKKPSKVGYKFENDKKVRFLKKSGSVIN